MAHDLEIVDGEAQMFSVRETPWHGLGKIVHEAPDSAAAIKLAGLDWTVSSRPMMTTQYPNGDGGLVPCSNFRAIVRDTDTSVLGCVGPDYTPLQNADAFRFFDPFVQLKEAGYETAGSLAGGRRIWVLAKLNRAPMEIVKGDAVEKFLLLSNGHDGTMAVRVGFTPIRVVCANTLAMAHGEGRSRLIRIFHGKQVTANLMKVREIVDAANAQFEATAEQYRALANSQVDQKSLKEYVKVVFNRNPETELQEVRLQKLTDDITAMFETGRGNDMPGVRGTAWAAYNAVTEHLSYQRGRLQDNRLNNLWFGDAANINQRAFDKALEMVAA